MITSQFDAYVRSRLERWGYEFNLWRPLPLLGHQSKNILAVLIEHKGELPPPNIGFKPLTIPPGELQMEDLVREIQGDAPVLAAVLRAYYGGAGRQGIERRALAEDLCGTRIRRQAYFQYHDMGFHRIAGMLAALARAA